MAILSWDKPRKVMSEETRRATGSSDSEIPGTYLRNMSDGDIRKWKAKLVGHKSGHPQVEIRKDSAVIVVSLLGGYKYKYYGREETKNFNIHIASAGPIQWTWEDYDNFIKAIEEAKEVLKKGGMK